MRTLITKTRHSVAVMAAEEGAICKKPTSLHEASAIVISNHITPVDYYNCMAAFIGFAKDINPDALFYAIAETPLPMNLILDAHIAGIAEHLAKKAGLNPPSWAGNPSRFLKSPTFIMGNGVAAELISKTFVAMRRRNIFCGARAIQ